MKKFLSISLVIAFCATVAFTSCKKENKTTEVTIDQVATPVITPEEGLYNDPIEVTISCTETGASIYYTTDGSTPCDTSNMYESPFLIENTATVKAIAYKEGMTKSEIASVTYTLDKIVANPVITPESGVYDDEVSVSISCPTNDALIYYTLDGSTPTMLTSELYTVPFTIKKSCTLNVKAFKTGYTESETITAEYEINSSLYGLLAVTFDGETNEYDIVEFKKTDNGNSFFLEFNTEYENIYLRLNFRDDKLPIGTFEFSLANSSQTGLFHENGSNLLIQEGSMTISHVEGNIYSIVIEKAMIFTSNTIPPAKKELNFEFIGEII